MLSYNFFILLKQHILEYKDINRNLVGLTQVARTFISLCIVLSTNFFWKVVNKCPKLGKQVSQIFMTVTYFHHHPPPQKNSTYLCKLCMDNVLLVPDKNILDTSLFYMTAKKVYVKFNLFS